MAPSPPLLTGRAANDHLLRARLRLSCDLLSVIMLRVLRIRWEGEEEAAHVRLTSPVVSASVYEYNNNSAVVYAVPAT